MRKNEVNLLLGDNLRKYRNLRSLTLRELSFIVNVSIKHLCEIEQGKSFVSSKLLCKISHALGVPEHALFDDGKSVRVKKVVICESDVSNDDLELFKKKNFDI